MLSDTMLHNIESITYSECASSYILCFHLLVRSCDYSMDVDMLLPANRCLVSLLNSEQC